MENCLRRWIKLIETANTVHRVYHGSPYPDIDRFRIANLRNRTCTPGTLSFTTSVETAKIYGDHVYAANVQGTFGDYLNPQDVETNFTYRWPKREASLRDRYPDYINHSKQFNKPILSLDEWLEYVADKDRAEIAAGHYAQWENVLLWRTSGWDGAWCVEHESRNLIVGNIDCVHILGLVDATLD